MKWISLVLFIATMFVNGCGEYQLRDGSFGRFRSSNNPYTALLGPSGVTIIPDNELVCVNGTDLLADVYIGSNLIFEGLGPGQIASYPLLDFYDGDTIIVTAYCYRDEVLIGKKSRVYNLRSRGGHKQLAFEIDRLESVRFYGDFKGRDLIPIPTRDIR